MDARLRSDSDVLIASLQTFTAASKIVQRARFILNTSRKVRASFLLHPKKTGLSRTMQCQSNLKLRTETRSRSEIESVSVLGCVPFLLVYGDGRSGAFSRPARARRALKSALMKYLAFLALFITRA